MRGGKRFEPVQSISRRTNTPPFRCCSGLGRRNRRETGAGWRIYTVTNEKTVLLLNNEKTVFLLTNEKKKCYQPMNMLDIVIYLPTMVLRAEGPEFVGQPNQIFHVPVNVPEGIHLVRSFGFIYREHYI